MLQLQKCIVRCIDDTNAVYPDCICDRMLIDRAMPAVNYGKGCMQTFSYCYMFLCPGFICLDRVGSEFWNQQVRIGNDVTGIK